MAHKYKNESGKDQTLIGVGIVKADGEVVVERPIENPNFKYVGEVETNKTANSVVGTEAPQPNAVTEASPVSDANGTEVSQ